MAEHEPEISILDQRLAEIDRRLSRIQVGLAEEVGFAEGARGAEDVRVAERPGRPVALAPPLGPGELDDDIDDDGGLVAAELRGLVGDHARLLDRLAELVSAGERLFAAPAVAPAAAAASAASGASAASTPPAATAAGALTVTAGPFASVDAVRAFERTLASLPGVTSAEVRGYEGGDRAVVDVHLSAATS